MLNNNSKSSNKKIDFNKKTPLGFFTKKEIDKLVDYKIQYEKLASQDKDIENKVKNLFLMSIIALFGMIGSFLLSVFSSLVGYNLIDLKMVNLNIMDLSNTLSTIGIIPLIVAIVISGIFELVKHIAFREGLIANNNLIWKWLALLVGIALFYLIFKVHFSMVDKIIDTKKQIYLEKYLQEHNQLLNRNIPIKQFDNSYYDNQIKGINNDIKVLENKIPIINKLISLNMSKLNSKFKNKRLEATNSIKSLKNDLKDIDRKIELKRELINRLHTKKDDDFKKYQMNLKNSNQDTIKEFEKTKKRILKEATSKYKDLYYNLVFICLFFELIALFDVLKDINIKINFKGGAIEELKEFIFENQGSYWLNKNGLIANPITTNQDNLISHHNIDNGIGFNLDNKKPDYLHNEILKLLTNNFKLAKKGLRPLSRETIFEYLKNQGISKTTFTKAHTNINKELVRLKLIQQDTKGKIPKGYSTYKIIKDFDNSIINTWNLKDI